MRSILSVKRAFKNEDVSQVWRNIADYVSAEEAWQAVEEAAAEVRTVCGAQIGKAVYGWSGGKDSIALQIVMERAGVRRAVLGTIPHVEWRQYLAWVDDHRPEGLTVIENRELTIESLARPSQSRYVFPRNSRDGYFWTLAGTRRAQWMYQERYAPPLQIYGRRIKDGNLVGPPPYGIWRTQRLVAYCPLRNWSHELALGVVYHAGRLLPPVYEWPHGWTTGTGAWPGRRIGTIEESWAETYAIEPEAVRQAARYMPAAREWLTVHA